ncbi:hypothetical protein Tco_1379737 [Tanacetum coccineum]
MDVTVKQWLDLMYGDHKKTRGDDEVELSDKEFSDPDNENLIEKGEVVEIFRIKTDIFDFETPICNAFNKFNYLLKINTDLLTSDILGFKTNRGRKMESPLMTSIIFVILSVSRMRKLNGPLAIQMMKDSVMEEITRDGLSWLHDLLSRLRMWRMKDHECSPFTNWRNHINGAYANTNIDANYNLYLDVSRIFNNHEGRNNEEGILEERELNDDHGIDNLNNDLVRDNASYHANDVEYEEDRCELLGNSRQEPSVCKIKRFKVIMYSFESAEKYITIKEHEHDDWPITKEDACHDYQEIFRIMDEGWFVTRAE